MTEKILTIDGFPAVMTDWLTTVGIGDSALGFTVTSVVLIVYIAIAVVFYYLCTRVVAPLLLKVVEKTKAKWDDMLLSRPVVKAITMMLETLMLKLLLPTAFDYYPHLRQWIAVTINVLVVVSVVIVVIRILSAIYDVLCTHTAMPARSLRGLLEMIQILVACVGAVVAVSLLINRSPLIILSGLGASAAVLMLVFKDPILGLVSGVRLTLNDMLRPGDWITAPKFAANGTVLEVNLTTVKVQNFDMTIVTIPPYALVSDSFQNWRGMQTSPGRRVMRSVCIDVNSVRFMESSELEKFVGQPWMENLPEGSRAVNLSVFRRYLEFYISSSVASTVPSMMAMVRELQPTPQGIPVELYFFTTHQEWKAYEHLQADVLDYVVATLPQFGLRIYQAPSGLDVLALRQV